LRIAFSLYSTVCLLVFFFTLNLKYFIKIKKKSKTNTGQTKKFLMKKKHPLYQVSITPN
jgi:hypothetical protein